MPQKFSFEGQQLESRKVASKIRVGEEEVYGNAHHFPLYGEDGQDCGYVIVSTIDGEKRARVTDISLDDEHRNRGFGTSIYEAIAAALAEQGYDLVSSPKHNDDSGRVWESLASKGLAVLKDGEYVMPAGDVGDSTETPAALQ